MASRPLLALPSAKSVSPPRLGGGGARPLVPPRNLQAKRLAPSFGRLQAALRRSPEKLLELRDDPTALAPDRVIVFEIAGTVADFARAASMVPGLELLAEAETSRDPDEHFAEADTRKATKGQRRVDKPVEGRFYLAMPDVAALAELVRLWNRWRKGEELGRGLTPFRHLFAQLRTLRPWGPADRISDDTVELLLAEEQSHPGATVAIELELWFHRAETRRRGASARVRELVAAADGRVLAESEILEIAYHALLIELPGAAMEAVRARTGIELTAADHVMHIRPQTKFEVQPEDAESLGGLQPGAESAPVGAPIAALLDGVPIQSHDLLVGRLILDDPDDLQSETVVARRFHGTAMASLIVRGDLNASERPLHRPLYVRPLLVTSPVGDERTPSDRLLVDTLHRAVVRIKGTKDEPGVAPTVCLVNLSLGDKQRPFAGIVSPLARLLDFLAERFNILFLVSAGNVSEPLHVPTYGRWGDFEGAAAEQRQRAVIQALFAAQHRRSILSPAESINSVTIGAQHSDNVSNRIVSMAVDPFDDATLPNASCAMGLGFRRGIKPELYFPGGREYVRFGGDAGGLALRFGPPQRIFGLRAAGPDTSLRGLTDQVLLSDGTSSATALATRAAHQIVDTVLMPEAGSPLAATPPEFYAVTCKALLAHSARWGSGCNLIRDLCGPADPRRHVERSANVSRFLGLGIPNIARVLDCIENQATLVGYGFIEPDGSHLYRIPLPASLEGVTDLRELAVTVAWISPVRAGNQSYRCAKLEAAPIKPGEALGVLRSSLQPADPTVKKGTIFHERFAGERAVPYIDDGHLSVQVWCKDDAGNEDRRVRYAIAVTIQCESPLPIYDEVRARLMVRAQATP